MSVSEIESFVSNVKDSSLFSYVNETWLPLCPFTLAWVSCFLFTANPLYYSTHSVRITLNWAERYQPLTNWAFLAKPTNFAQRRLAIVGFAFKNQGVLLPTLGLLAWLWVRVFGSWATKGSVWCFGFYEWFVWCLGPVFLLSEWQKRYLSKLVALFDEHGFSDLYFFSEHSVKFWVSNNLIWNDYFMMLFGLDLEKMFLQILATKIFDGTNHEYWRVLLRGVGGRIVGSGLFGDWVLLLLRSMLAGAYLWVYHD